MRQTLHSKWSIAHTRKRSVLNREFSRDEAASANEHEEEIDRRVHQLLEMEDTDMWPKISV